MSYNEFMEVLNSRRSIRKFTDEQITKDEIVKIIDAGRTAPSGFNSQPWEFVVVQDLELRTEIVRYIQAYKSKVELEGFKANMSSSFATAPTFIIIYGDTKVREFGLPHILSSDDSWTFTLDTTLAYAAENMHLATYSLGLGSMWITASRNPDIDSKIKKLLNIPKDLLAFELLVVGHPDMEPTNKKLRSIDEMLHWNKVSNDEFRTRDDIAEFFNKK